MVDKCLLVPFEGDTTNGFIWLVVTVRCSGSHVRWVVILFSRLTGSSPIQRHILLSTCLIAEVQRAWSDEYDHAIITPVQRIRGMVPSNVNHPLRSSLQCLALDTKHKI
ncbi:hypothetical protein DAEQUDRAFT_254076 [Daedalea quercina L-15889]|uniref:Uncharacterized protein n=1 Tax=Daedalea quercina L-15889 TaxID=1314783 RepID=A0A165QHS7_9APHY|nr:hypothetical protein DAEQUDRAFT_254076 [Daedalea quercina L-15889]